jgi:hypothetical protein
MEHTVDYHNSKFAADAAKMNDVTGIMHVK